MTLTTLWPLVCRKTPFSTPLMQYSLKSTWSVSLYFIDDSIDNSRFLLEDQLDCVYLSSTLFYLSLLGILYALLFNVSHGFCLCPLWSWFLLDVLSMVVSVSSTKYAPWCSFNWPTHFNCSFFFLSSDFSYNPHLLGCGTVLVLVLWCFWEVLFSNSLCVFWGGSILQWFAFNIKGVRGDLMLSPFGLLPIFKEDVVHRVDPMLRWIVINPLTSLQLW